MEGKVIHWNVTKEKQSTRKKPCGYAQQKLQQYVETRLKNILFT